MDKCSIVAIACFIFALGFTIASLAVQEWIIISTPDYSRLGLFRMCIEERITGQYQCKYMDLSIEWSILFILVIGSALFLIVTIYVMCLSLKKPQLQIPCKVLSVFTLFIFCSATLIFPVGFMNPTVGGEPYRLPSNASIGICFHFFFCGNLLTCCGTLLAHRSLCYMVSSDQSDQQQPV